MLENQKILSLLSAEFPWRLVGLDLQQNREKQDCVCTLYYTKLHYTLLHQTIMHLTALSCTVQYFTALSCTKKYFKPVLYYNDLHRTVLQQTVMNVRALHRGSSKYLTAKDTRIPPTLTKHAKTLVRLIKLLSLQPLSIIQIGQAFSVPSIE